MFLITIIIVAALLFIVGAIFMGLASLLIKLVPIVIVILIIKKLWK